MKQTKLKILIIVLFATMSTMLVLPFSACNGCFCSCMDIPTPPTPAPKEPMTEEEWIAMWDNTEHEMTKADANFKISDSHSGVNEHGNYSFHMNDFIVTSNKAVRTRERSYLLICQNNNLYRFLYAEYDGFLRMQSGPSEETMGKNLWYNGGWSFFEIWQFQFLYDNFRNNFTNMRYLGNRMYTSSFIYVWQDIEIYREWFIAVSNGLINQLSFRSTFPNGNVAIRTHDIIFGGQSITLPNYTKAKPLPSPSNL